MSDRGDMDGRTTAIAVGQARPRRGDGLMRRLLRRGDPYADYRLRVDVNTHEGYHVPLFDGSFQAMRFQVDYAGPIVRILDHPDVVITIHRGRR